MSLVAQSGSAKLSEKKQVIVHSGLLEKRGHFRKNWLTRLFVLGTEKLEYYKQKSPQDGWVSHPKLKRGEILLSSILAVEATGFKDRKHCFLVRVDRPKKKSLEFLFQASNENEKNRWIKHLRAGMVDGQVVNIGQEVFNLLLEGTMSTCGGPATIAVKAIKESFPIFAQLLKEMNESENEKELVYILDQLVLEVKEGAGGDVIKKTLMTAAQCKLAKDPQLWTGPVKTAYGSVMRAVQTQQFFKMGTGSISRHLSVGSEGEIDFIRRTFSQTYKNGRKLGSGASSVVRVAQHRETQKQYAVKCILKPQLRESERQSIQQEVQIMQSLEHENLVPLLDYFDEPEAFYIVTPLCTGGELFDQLVKRACYTEEDARVLMKKLASAIDYLHQKGIVHRDLKPENILLKTSAPDAEIMIADFGFAKSTGSGLRQGTACGTPGYIAPEIVNGQAYGTEVDCWSLGVILYILLCGYPPFPGDHHVDILKKVAAGQYNFNSPYWDNVTDGAKDLVRGLLNVNSAERLTAHEILQHPWISQGNVVTTQLRMELERRPSDLTPALNEMRKFNQART